MYTFRFRFLTIFCTVITSLLIVACSGANQNDSLVEDLSGSWQVENIDGAGVIDNSHITVEFLDDDQIAGSTGCNRYRGSIARHADKKRLSISQLSVTRRACRPAITAQEKRFLTALESAERVELTDDTWLLVFDSQGKPRLKLIALDSETDRLAEEVAQDRATTQSHKFQCGANDFISVRFVGPETVSLLMHGESFLLQRDASASGAQYVGDDIRFWNKGSVATLQRGSENARDCLLISD